MQLCFTHWCASITSFASHQLCALVSWRAKLGFRSASACLCFSYLQVLKWAEVSVPAMLRSALIYSHIGLCLCRLNSSFYESASYLMHLLYVSYETLQLYFMSLKISINLDILKPKGWPPISSTRFRQPDKVNFVFDQAILTLLFMWLIQSYKYWWWYNLPRE